MTFAAPANAETSRRTARVIIALVAIWVPAVLVGLVNTGLGAGVAAAGGLVLLGVWARTFDRSLLRRVDWGLVGVVLIAASPLAPARLGLDFAGVGVDDLPLVAGVLLAGLSVIRNEGFGALVPKVSWPLYAFALWNGVIAVIDTGLALDGLAKGLGRWLIVAIALSSVVAISKREGRGWVILGAVVVVGTLEALFGIWAYFVDWTVESDTRAVLIGLERWRDYQLLFGRNAGRIAGTLGVSSNFFGALMLIPGLVAAGWFQRSKTRMEMTAFGLAALAMVYALALSYTRASLIALGIGAVLAAVLMKRIRFAALMAGAMVLVVATTPILERFSEANDRAALAGKSLDAIFEDPATGLGSGSFVDSLFDEDSPVLIATPHNSFLLAAAETGIPGGLIFLVATMLPAVVLLRRTGLRGPAPPVLAAICGGLLAFGAQALSNNIYHIPGVAMFYWVVVGAGLGLSAKTSEQTS